ncbi:hypothetical protein Q4595_16800, partial [Wenyingzhuangia sp. 1_MG-2023]|nr:hypothetical protein [Wenyingzhuangia sp. 1_MG-2023]
LPFKRNRMHRTIMQASRQAAMLAERRLVKLKCIWALFIKRAATGISKSLPSGILDLVWGYHQKRPARARR